ncbi:MAG: hypothetical protein V1816_18040 [Pseudomonadota bacterium]
MGQAANTYRGKTWRLERALNLIHKDNLTPEEALALVECGRMCAARGAEIVSAGANRPDAARVLAALLVTSDRMLDRVRGHLDETDPEAAERTPLADGLTSAQRESFYLAHWAQQLSAPDQSPRYNA